MKKVYLLVIASVLSLVSVAQYSTHSFTFGAETRQYLLYVPPSYDGSEAVPFVLVLHGLGDNMNNFKGVRFEDVADTANFIFAIPQALVDNVITGSTAWNSGAGAFGITLNSNVDDVGFLNAIMDSTSAAYNIDQTRLYSTGFSMGGFMTNRLGCELNNRIAAIASVSGTIGSGITCNPSRVVPACHFHGTSDGTVAYSGNMFGNDAEALVEYWRGHDQCDVQPASVDTFPHISGDTLRVVHFVYPNGAYGSDVEFYKVLGGAHQWLGPYGDDVNYALEIWKFFRRYKWEPQTAAGISESTLRAATKIYPNPAAGELHISLDGAHADGLTITLRDMTGRMIYTAQGAADISISTVNFARGVYTVEIAADGQRYNSKVAIAD